MLEHEQYARHVEPLLPRAIAYARSILRDRHKAEDAVQQAAMRGLERLQTFDSSRSFKGWWFAIVRNCCIDLLRHAKSTRAESLGDYDRVDPASSQSSDWQMLADAMARLSPEHRDILQLKYFADQSYAEIAMALSIPQGTVMSRLHAARQALAKQLEAS